jgi:hypothetical protein
MQAQKTSRPTDTLQTSDHQLTYGSPQDKRFTYSFFERFGGYYDGTLNEFRVRATYRPTAKFSASVSTMESLSSSVAEWEFLCGLGGPSRQLLVQPVPDFHESHPDGYFQYPGGEHQSAPALQLSA